jgi:hypothetical protein
MATMVFLSLGMKNHPRTWTLNATPRLWLGSWNEPNRMLPKQGVQFHVHVHDHAENHWHLVVMLVMWVCLIVSDNKMVNDQLGKKRGLVRLKTSLQRKWPLKKKYPNWW